MPDPIDPIQELEALDFADFLKEAGDALGDEGRAWAENVARQLTESVRQTRNDLEAAVDQPRTQADMSDSSDVSPPPKVERDLEASFQKHLTSAFGRVTDGLARKMEAETFMGVYPDGRRPITLSLDQYTQRQGSNLGPHPHSKESAIPIPKGYEAAIPYAKELQHLTPKEQAKWLMDYTKAKAQSLPTPDFPRPILDDSAVENFGGKVKFIIRQRPQDQALKKLIGKVTNEELARLTGIPNGAEAAVLGDERHGVTVNATHPFMQHQVRTIARDDAGKLFVRNDYFVKNEKAPERFLLRSLAVQVQEARQRGVAYLEADAARTEKYIGYRVLPEYGFDGPIPDDLRQALVRDIPRMETAARLSDLLDDKEAWAWWKANGRTVKLRFNLEGDSRSIDRLTLALRQKGILYDGR
ncbi:MAG: hypothetical protein HS116_18495 [Planctomycetes bacterium]|nr:hypothetical protein [Planctomycetota bacterium]